VKKNPLPFLAAVFALTIAGFADDGLRDVQAQLKTQGFYYGEINGEKTSETTAAIRRYQIRNGLEVTGTLTDETIKSLGIGVAPGPQEAPPAAQPLARKPPVNLRRDQPLEQSDKNFLRREETQQRGAEPAPPIADEAPGAPAPRSSEGAMGELPLLFAGTPYANAPREVQESTLRRAQGLLASRGIYRDDVDGLAGPATEEAILSYQRSARLPLSGRLDLETLSAMHLLPGRGPAPLRGYIPEQRPTSGLRIYRGIWIH